MDQHELEAFWQAKYAELEVELEKVKEEKLKLHGNIRNLCDENRGLCADLVATKGALKDRTKEEIHALIEKYGDPRYKTNEFALYDVISAAQQLQVATLGAYNRGYIKGLAEGRE